MRQFRGGSRIFFRRGCTLVSCSTSTPINHIVFSFLQNTSCIRKPQVISGGEGVHPLSPPPRSTPAVPSFLSNSRQQDRQYLCELLKDQNSPCYRQWCSYQQHLSLLHTQSPSSPAMTALWEFDLIMPVPVLYTSIMNADTQKLMIMYSSWKYPYSPHRRKWKFLELGVGLKGPEM